MWGRNPGGVRLVLADAGSATVELGREMAILAFLALLGTPFGGSGGQKPGLRDGCLHPGGAWPAAGTPAWLGFRWFRSGLLLFRFAILTEMPPIGYCFCCYSHPGR